MTEGTSTSGAPAATETAGPVAAVAVNAANAAPAPAPVDAHVAAMAAAAAMAAPPPAPAAKPEVPAVGPAAAALAAIEAAAAVEAAAAKKAEKAEKANDDSDETSMSDAEVLPEVELASLGEAGAATAGQAGLPCGVLPVVDAPVAAVPPPVAVPVGDAGFGFSPVLLGLLGLGALGLGYLLLKDDDDDDDIVDENDPPVAANEAIAADEDDATITGQLDATDPDDDDLTFELDAAVPGLDVAADGSYTFDVAEAGLDNLAAGETATITADYTVTDPDGASDVGTITITVTGVNEAPLITSGATANVDENVPAGTEVYDANATDPDGDTLTYSIGGADAAFFTIDPATGEVFIVNSPDFETRATYNITVTATDPGGMTDTQDVVITVNDVAEGPVLTAQSLDVDNDSNTVTPFQIDAGAQLYQFVDAGAVANNVELINFGADDTIVFDTCFDDVAFTNLGNVQGGAMGELSITINQGGVLTEIVIVDAVAADAIVLDEATAEAAMAGTNTFLTTCGTAGSLDIDSDNNLGTANVVTVGAGNVAFTDDSLIASNTTLVGFNAGDTIATNADADVTFANAGGGDLLITIEENGVVSTVLLQDAIAADAVVTNEATAEAAIGSNFFMDAAAAGTLESIDVDDDADLTTAMAVDAGADAFVFVDNAAIGNNVLIADVSANDSLVLNADPASVSYANVGGDLVVTVTEGGVTSTITLDAAVDPAATVDSETTAETALGFDFFQFA